MRSSGFAEEEMDVLGHEDIGVEGEVVGAAGLLDDLFEDVFWFGGGEVGETLVTTEGDEVGVGLCSGDVQGRRACLDFIVGEGERFALRANAHSCGETA